MTARGSKMKTVLKGCTDCPGCGISRASQLLSYGSESQHATEKDCCSPRSEGTTIYTGLTHTPQIC